MIKNNPLLYILIFCQLNVAVATDSSKAADAEANLFIKEELLPFINRAHNTVYKHLGQQITCHYDPKVNVGSCPPYLLDMVEDNYEGGTEGAIFSAGSAIFGTKTDRITTPDKTCGNVMVNITPQDFVKQLNSGILAPKVNKNILANSYSCLERLDNVLLDKNQKTRAQRYILSAMVHHPAQLEAGFKNMLEAKSQLDMMIGQEKKEDCSKLPTKELINFCEMAENCKTNNQTTYIKNKSTELKEALEVIRKIKMEKRQLSTVSLDGMKKRKQADLGIKSIEDLYPILKSSSFNYVMIQTDNHVSNIDISSVEKALKKDILNVRKKVSAQLTQLHLANDCITGKRSKCNNFHQVLDEAAPDWKLPTELPFDNYYSCVDNSKIKRNESNQMLNSALATAILTVTPMGITATAGSLYKAGKLIKTAATYAKTTKATMIFSAAADTTLSEVEAAKIYGACRSKLDTLVDYNKQAPTCEILDRKVTLSKDVSTCHQQIISGILSTAFTGMGLGLAKYSQEAAAVVPDNMTGLIKHVDDAELDKLYSDLSLHLKDPKKRISVITKLNEGLSKISKSKEYSPQEIKSAMKVLLKRCMD